MKICNSLSIGEFLQLVYVYSQACRTRLIYMEDRVKTLLTQEARAKEISTTHVPPEKSQRASDDSADALAGWTQAMDLLCDTLEGRSRSLYLTTKAHSFLERFLQEKPSGLTAPLLAAESHSATGSSAGEIPAGESERITGPLGRW